MTDKESKEKEVRYRLIEGRFPMSEKEFVEALDDDENRASTAGFWGGLVCGLVLSALSLWITKMLAEIILLALK